MEFRVEHYVFDKYRIESYCNDDPDDYYIKKVVYGTIEDAVTSAKNMISHFAENGVDQVTIINEKTKDVVATVCMLCDLSDSDLDFEIGLECAREGENESA